MPGVCVVFKAAPPLKYAENVVLHSRGGPSTVNSSEAFMHNFSGTKELRLGFDYDVFNKLSWTFLRQETARELRLIKLTWGWHWQEASHSVEEFIRYCATLPRRLGGDPLELDFSATEFSGAFALRIIELLNNSAHEVIFRMTTEQYRGKVKLDESEYTVDDDGTTTRYTSAESGIVVEVQGNLITIRSSAEVPWKKPRMEEEVLPTIPFVEH